MHRTLPFLALAGALAVAAPCIARAQATRADSAAILLDAARRLDVEGKRAAADAVLDYILRRFGDTPAAADAKTRLAGRPAEPERSGRLELLAWGAIDGAWLGIAVPLALGATGTAPYGIGLIAGGPVGFFVAKTYADAARPTLGQARAITFGFNWGTWQTVGWLAALTSGDLHGETVFASMVAGGVGGAAFAAAYGRHRTVPAGAMTAVSQGAYWGTWFGMMCWPIFGLTGDAGLRLGLAAGDVGLLVAALTAPKDISPGRVWLTTAAGIAGIAVGGGIDLLLQPSDAKTAAAIPVATSAVGLIAGVALAKGAERVRSARAPARSAPEASALLQVDEAGTRLGVPFPVPTLVPVGERGPRRLYRPALAVPLLRATF
jgi:hypothetical protein